MQLFYFLGNVLIDHLGENSPIRSNIILRNHTALRTAANFVVIKYAHEDRVINLTGIPPHVMYLVQIETTLRMLQQQHEENRNLMQSTSDRIISEIRADLDSRSIGGGEVSINRLQSLLHPFRDKLNRINQRLAERAETDGNRQSSSQREDEPESPPPQYCKYDWGGKWRRLPENWKFNRNMTVLLTWQLWHHRDDTTSPLKFIEKLDLTDTQMVNGKARPVRGTEVRHLNSLKYLCGELDRVTGINRTNVPSLGEIVQLYNTPAVQDIIPQTLTERSRVRRADELNWRYAVDVMKDEKKRRTADAIQNNVVQTNL